MCRRIVAYKDTRETAVQMSLANRRDCVCQGSMFSPSAFSVGRARDTSLGRCGEAGGGITVTAVSDMFTVEVFNPVRRFVLDGAINKVTQAWQQITDHDSPVQQIQSKSYYQHPNGLSPGIFTAVFKVSGWDSKPINGKATNVKIQWIEIPASVPTIDAIDAQYFGGQQVSACPKGGNVLPTVAAAAVQCVLGGNASNCDDPAARKTEAYGRIDRVDPLCEGFCTNSPFIVLDHTVHGSYDYFNISSGMWDVQISIMRAGRYAIRLEVDGVTSPIIFFQARSKAARIEIVRQPKARFEGNSSNPGDLFEVQPGNSNDIHVKFAKWDATKYNIALALFSRALS